RGSGVVGCGCRLQKSSTWFFRSTRALQRACQNYGRCKSFKFKGGRARRTCAVETVEVNFNSGTALSCSRRQSDSGRSVEIVVPTRAIETINQKRKTIRMRSAALVFFMAIVLRQ